MYIYSNYCCVHMCICIYIYVYIYIYIYNRRFLGPDGLATVIIYIHVSIPPSTWSMGSRNAENWVDTLTAQARTSHKVPSSELRAWNAENWAIRAQLCPHPQHHNGYYYYSPMISTVWWYAHFRMNGAQSPLCHLSCHLLPPLLSIDYWNSSFDSSSECYVRLHTHYLYTLLHITTVMLIVTVQLFRYTCVFLQRQHYHCPPVLY